MAERWLRPDDIISTVVAWTGIHQKDLTSPHGSRRVVRAKRLLAAALRVGLDMSKLEVMKVMGYTRNSGSGGSFGGYKHLFDTDPPDATEVAEIILLAKDRARV